MGDAGAVVLGSRGRTVLRVLVAEYLKRGAPVSSRRLSQLPEIAASAATVRNVMADLEAQDLLVSPHWSAGRIPSVRGLRFFVDKLLRVLPPSSRTITNIRDGLQGDSTGEVMDASARMISKMTRYAGFIVIAPQTAVQVRRLQFIKLSSNRLLAVMEMSPGDDVINRIFDYEGDISAVMLESAARFYNERFSGVPIDEASRQLQGQVFDLHTQIADLLKLMISKVGGDMPPKDGDLRVFGKTNLVTPDIADDIGQLQGLYDLLRRKKELLRLLQSSARGEDVRLFIGSECGIEAMDECSVVFSSCDEDDKPLGIVGVIGPKRMRYHKIIPTVDVTARMIKEILHARQWGGGG